MEAVLYIAALISAAFPSFSKLKSAQVIVSAINWAMTLRGLQQGERTERSIGCRYFVID